jgi:hypothetical protein
MPQEQDNLAVRRHDRLRCDLDARCRIADGHEAQLALSQGVTDAEGAIELRVVDCSEGGLGLRSPVFLPKGALLSVDVPPPGGGGPERLRFGLRIQRVEMVDRAPAYYLGTSLSDEAAGTAAVGTLLQRLRADRERAA